MASLILKRQDPVDLESIPGPEAGQALLTTHPVFGLQELLVSDDSGNVIE